MITQITTDKIFYLFGTTFGLYVLLYGVKRILCFKIGKLIKKPSNFWDNVFVTTAEKTSHFFLIVSSAYAAFYLIAHKQSREIFADRFFFAALMIQIGIWANFLVDRWICSSISKKTRRNPAAASSISLLQFLAKVVLVSTIILFTLNNMGIKITTILAGLSVGGLAVALAVQKILGDLFSSLSIVMDKPFMVGDFIVLGDYLGEVEKIGLRTTQIRSLGGEQIIISNSDLLASRIRNYQRMKERRVHFQLPISTKMTTDKMKEAVSLISAIVSKRDGVRFDRCHFTEITREALKIETVYHVLSDEYLVYLDHHQSILMDVHAALMAQEIQIAGPTTAQIVPSNTEVPRTEFPVSHGKSLS